MPMGTLEMAGSTRIPPWGLLRHIGIPLDTVHQNAQTTVETVLETQSRGSRLPNPNSFSRPSGSVVSATKFWLAGSCLQTVETSALSYLFSIPWNI